MFRHVTYAVIFAFISAAIFVQVDPLGRQLVRGHRYLMAAGIVSLLMVLFSLWRFALRLWVWIHEYDPSIDGQYDNYSDAV